MRYSTIGGGKRRNDPRSFSASLIAHVCTTLWHEYIGADVQEYLRAMEKAEVKLLFDRNGRTAKENV
jgi:hypothetical protein